MAHSAATQPATTARVAAQTSTSAGRGSEPLLALASVWLDEKVTASRVRDPRNSDEARRGDLCRLGRALRGAALDAGGHDLPADLAGLTVADLTPKACSTARDKLAKHYTDATVARTMATVRGFVTWLVDRKDLAGDPRWAGALRTTRPDSERLERILDRDDVDALLAAAAAPARRDRAAWPARDVAIIAVLAGAGLRASELCALDVTDLQRSDDPQSRFAGTLHVDGNGRARDVPFGADVLGRVDDWLAQRGTGGGALFVRHDGRRMDRSFLHRLVKRCAREANVDMPGAAVTHALRHHLGVQLALDGEPTAVIQARLGHADGRMAALYQKVAARVAHDRSGGALAALVDAATPRR